MYVCYFCGLAQFENNTRCERCRAYKMLVKQGVEKKPKKTKPILAANIQASRVKRIKTGVKAWDEVLGGGWVKPSTVMIWGPPGVGKSTWCIRLAEKIAEKENRESLYLSGEMPIHMMANAAERTGPRPEHVYIWDTQDCNKACEEIAKIGPVCIVWDSIQAFWAKGECGTDKAIREMVRRAREIGEEVDAVTILISQSNKDGDAAGPYSSIHAVDAVIRLDKDRVSIPSKNRYGITPKSEKFVEDEEKK